MPLDVIPTPKAGGSRFSYSNTQLLPTDDRRLHADNRGMSRRYFVYIMASRSRTLYIGVTGHLLARVAQHRSLAHVGFTRKYRCTRLVLVEETDDVYAAIAREKQLKGWRREKKVALIESSNPTWADLFELFTA